MFREHHHHLFLRNKEMNEIYISVFLMKLAASMITIFVPIYLYTLGYSIVAILCFFLVRHAASVVFAVPFAKVVAKVGVKHSVLISAPFLILYYWGLQMLPEYSWLFFLLPVLLAFRALFYNFGFHLNFADHLERDNVGKELSAMAVLSVSATVIAPLVSGLMIMALGYSSIFMVGSALLVISTLPLLFSADKRRDIDFTLKKMAHLFVKRKNAGMVLSFSGYAIESSIGNVIWPIFLIILLGTAEKVGFIVAIAALATVLVVSMYGKLADRVSPKKLLSVGSVLYFFGWLGCLLADSFFKASFIDIYRKISGRFLMLPWSSLFYSMFARERYFQLVVWRDMVFNFIRVLIFPLIILIFVINWHPFIVVFVVAALFSLLYPFMNRVEEMPDVQ